MPGPILHQGAVVQCPHLIPGVLATTQPRVLVAAAPALLSTDLVTFAGCPFTVGTKPQPCVRAMTMPAARVKVNGVPVVTTLGAGLCLSPEQLPNGPAFVSMAQPRVVAT
jgi:hypothetical protein